MCAKLMRDAYGNIKNDPGYSIDTRYLSFPFSQYRHSDNMSAEPRRYSNLIDPALIVFHEAAFSSATILACEYGEKRFIHYASYPLLDDVLIDAELNTDLEFLLDYAGYGFASQLESMSAHDALDFVERVSEMKRKTDRESILDRVTPRFSTREEAEAWYHSEPLPGFSGATAMQLVSQGRAKEVLDYIDAVDAGGYA